MDRLGKLKKTQSNPRLLNPALVMFATIGAGVMTMRV